MKTKTLIIAAVLSLSLMTSCREQKEKEVTEDAKVEEVKEKTEVDEAEKKRLDSIRQVKEHGHAH